MTEIEIPHANGSRLVDADGAVPEQREPADAPPPGVWRGPQDPQPHPQPQQPDDDQDEDEPGAPVPVDQDPGKAPAQLPWQAPGTAKPIVPAWVLDSAQRKAAASWSLRWLAHGSAFHLVRVPKYATRACLYTPRGLARAAVAWFRWVFDWDAHALRMDLIQKREAKQYHVAARHRDDRLKNRALGSLALAATGVLGTFIGTALYAPTPYLLLTAVGLVLVWHGRPVGKPFLVDRTVISNTVARLTSDVIARALGSIGIADLRREIDKGKLEFTAPIVRDGPGWRAEIDLPYGVTAVDIIELRRELSSGLRRPLGCVWPEPEEEEHSGHLILWVGDKPLSKTRPVAYPLLERGATDMFMGLPFGVDAKGNPVTVTLMFASVACGAQPRMGKTFSVRLLALGAALDPRCELHIYDGKGMGDYVAFEPIAHWIGSGSRDEVLLSLLADLKALKVEVDRRAVLLTKLARAGRCREGKITPELVKDKSLNLYPILILLDECHLAFDTGTGPAGKLGQEITEIAEYLVRVGPAAGVSLIASTQRPDAKSLPSGISANVQVRFCLRVAGQPTNDMVLGTSAYKSGVRATEFSRKDLGIGYLSGEGLRPVIVRSYLADSDDASKVTARAYLARKAAGRITGMAAGLEAPRESDPAELLADVLAAMGGDEQIWSSAVCERLAEAHPGRYAGWSADQLGKSLRALGVVTAQTWWTPPEGKATNRNGVTRQQIADALAEARKTAR